jgi:D-proline reductase (dithiol) PrdB
MLPVKLVCRVMDRPESIENLRRSFAYGSRSNLNFKFLKDLSDEEFGDFLEQLLTAVSSTIDDGNATAVIDAAFRWQVQGYSGHLGDPADFPHRHEDVPLTPMSKPLDESRVALITSSGHFVEGDDPQPFGETSMSQQEAEDRIQEFLREDPALSAIPFETPPDRMRVRHGGYPVQAAASDHQVALPIGHLKALRDEGVIADLVPDAYSFVGAASQLRIQRDVAPKWAERLKEAGADVALLVPV